MKKNRFFHKVKNLNSRWSVSYFFSQNWVLHKLQFVELFFLKTFCVFFQQTEIEYLGDGKADWDAKTRRGDLISVSWQHFPPLWAFYSFSGHPREQQHTFQKKVRHFFIFKLWKFKKQQELNEKMIATVSFLYPNSIQIASKRMVELCQCMREKKVYQVTFKFFTRQSNSASFSIRC